MPGGVLWAKAQLTDNMRTVLRVLTDGPDAFDDLYSPNLVNHPPLPVPGPDGMRAVAQRFQAAFSDLKMYIEYQFEDAVDRDRVVTVWRLAGTQTGDLETPLGVLKATNKPAEIWMTTIVRIENGKIVERWGQV
jgi:predicted ester cyclase